MKCSKLQMSIVYLFLWLISSRRPRVEWSQLLGYVTMQTTVARLPSSFLSSLSTIKRRIHQSAVCLVLRIVRAEAPGYQLFYGIWTVTRCIGAFETEENSGKDGWDEGAGRPRHPSSQESKGHFMKNSRKRDRGGNAIERESNKHSAASRRHLLMCEMNHNNAVTMNR